MFVVSVAGAQEKSNENQLALLYYSKGEFQKAAEIYETLFTQTHSQIHFDYLIDCYQKLEQFGKAEKIILEQISYFPKNYYYQVSLAVLYFKQNKQKEAQEIITKNTKRALRNSFDCIEYVDACIDNKQYELAQTFLEVAVKKYADFEPLYKKQIAIYSKLLQYEKLSSAVIDLLEVNPL
ncbi:MAG TPA: hypothetical protein PLS12_06955, partial [Bacteroidales bacterium]|nr:hypothetical protein [Bacteroidales bacterium]